VNTVHPRAGKRIEIAGVAGTGKSTLCAALCTAGNGWVVADSLHARRPGHLPYLAAGLPTVLPMAAGSARRGARPSWGDVKDALYVSVWHRYLAAHADFAGRTVLLDQGPLFALARLRWIPSPLAAAPGFRTRWRDALALWAGELDGVVWLDAPDDVLLARINARARTHLVKNRPRDEALAFLGASRRALAAVLNTVAAARGVPILSIDTATCTPEQAGRRVAAWAGASVGAAR
jgi:gluconate kinase